LQIIKTRSGSQGLASEVPQDAGFRPIYTTGISTRKYQTLEIRILLIFSPAIIISLLESQIRSERWIRNSKLLRNSRSSNKKALPPAIPQGSERSYCN
jgi:hypothetical protein